MGLLDVLKRWSTFPVVETTTYQCTNCGVLVDEAEPSCPECGGDVTEMTHSSMELYWPHH